MLEAGSIAAPATGLFGGQAAGVYARRHHRAGDEAADQENDVVADLEMADDADAPGNDTAAPDLRAACNRGRAADDGVCPDAHVVCDLHEIVDLDAFLDDRIVDRAAVDRAVRTD